VLLPAAGIVYCRIAELLLTDPNTIVAREYCLLTYLIIIIIIIIIASHEDEMNDKYNDKLCTSNEVIQ